MCIRETAYGYSSSDLMKSAEVCTVRTEDMLAVGEGVRHQPACTPSGEQTQLSGP